MDRKTARTPAERLESLRRRLEGLARDLQAGSPAGRPAPVPLPVPSRRR